MTFTFFALPAIASLLAKVGIFAYARLTKLHNAHTRLYLLLLAILATLNLVEISLFVNHADGVVTPLIENKVRLWLSLNAIGLAVFVQLALVMSVHWKTKKGNLSLVGVVLLYTPVVLLLTLLWGSRLIVIGFEPMSYTYTRIPGSIYFLLETYFGGYLTTALAMFVYGAYASSTAFQRAQNKLLLVGSVPMVLLGITIIVLQRLGFRVFNGTATLTVAMIFCLAFMAYAIHQRRLFDVEYFVPWSETRRRKNAFYNGVHEMIARMVNIGTVGDMVRQISDTLRCPIVLVSGPTPAFAMAGDAHGIARFPLNQLSEIDRFLVANEIEEIAPEMYTIMKRHKIAAILPFHPHSEAAASWMLLGEAFSEQVYAPLDFKIVESLFARLEDHFLDTQLLVRYQNENSRWVSGRLEALPVQVSHDGIR